MASHVPFLAVRPNEQFAPEVKTHDFGSASSATDSTTSHRRTRSSATKSTTHSAAAKVSSAASATATRAETALQRAAPGGGGVRAGLARARRGVPRALRFPLVCAASLGLRLALYSAVADWAGLQLASVSRELGHDWQVGAVLGWKVLELAGAWWAEYEWLDLASLSFLSNLPYYFLLSTFYSLAGLPIWTALAIDTVSLTLPFLVLSPRPTTTSDESVQRPSARSVSRDYQILGLASSLAAAILALALYASFATWLPVHMIRHFDNVRSLDQAHETTVVSLAALFLPAGLAAMQFLFLPAVGASNRLLAALEPLTHDDDAPFDPETATLTQTVAYNLGLGSKGLSAKSEVLVKRTAALALGSFVNTLVRVYGTVEGAEVSGALGWSGLWAAAIVAVGFGFEWVAE